MVDTLEVRLGSRRVGALTGLGGDRTVFTFDDDYADDPARPTLSLGFKAANGDLIREHRPTQTRLAPFFSNLLPEGRLRNYLAERAGVKPAREFFLLAALGDDLPGAVSVQAPDGARPQSGEDLDEAEAEADGAAPLRFSLAGVQLKFSAIEQARGGLSIPAHGVGGDWIVKLPSAVFAGVSENEFSMMSLAAAIGIDVPPIRLVALDQIAALPEAVGGLHGAAFAIRRFDRLAGGERVHMEDFAQVFGVYPEEKYDRASYRNIAEVLWRETGEDGVTEFVRRLVFNALIGNADMHVKNWSLLYRDGLTPTLSPAYDFVATLAYIPDDKAALKVARSKLWTDFSADELSALAAKAGLPERLVLATARETVERFREVWRHERQVLPLTPQVAAVVDRQLEIVPLAR